VAVDDDQREAESLSVLICRSSIQMNRRQRARRCRNGASRPSVASIGEIRRAPAIMKDRRVLFQK
jgi:hypothetical protein